MEVEQFTSTRQKAIELFKSQPKGGKDIVSLDAIFISLCSLANARTETGTTRQERTAARPGSQQPPAPWFTETLAALKGKGESITVARFLMFANRFPVKRMDQVNAARWLRDAGYIPRKTGGNLVFDL
ncbi:MULTISPECIES: hypothetical protein [Stenotrophomonas]|jgi:hypothetical protein|uniref:hypothetical protein n=1 Tax=Stenotrophomonas TaxID=40323 RepID=UPI00066C60E3|nr:MULTISPECIES: hypothetical protein [Stenotrophomonas]KPG87365.1 hypothetical protein AN993_04840 [Stenotrophomonas maltophilia]MBA0241929.1 hypothetical protein [Stenotrophomonas maltophilia]MBA0246774.1 hypothetical protein [Stenotrophomonas maltophilia]MBA0305733.1 hypothetical protein [Stenotrophomonas maltophilia]MBA0437362.1 hypothetical protein [Stenotrophomonas maltophilia]